MKKLFVSILLIAIGISSTYAQCAMCKATLENNISNGNIGIAAGINFGILYMFVAPYLAVATLAYFWYRTSKRNEKFSKGSFTR